MAPEISAALQEEIPSDVELLVFPCLCLAKTKKEKFEQLMNEVVSKQADRLLICSNSCGMLRQVSEVSAKFQVLLNMSCFSHLIPAQLLEYIVQKGGYVISAGWLKNWRENLANAGFDSTTARRFFGDFCTELVMLDSGVQGDLQSELQSLASYLSLPCQIIPVELERIRVLVREQIVEWRFRKRIVELDESIKKLQQENAEYASLLHMMKGISILGNKRDVIERIKEIFMRVFGAQDVVYTENLRPLPPEFDGAEVLVEEQGINVIELKDGNGLMGSLVRGTGVFGIVKAQEFLFPQYMARYMGLVPGLMQICSVLLENLNYVESIERQKQHLEYLGNHDALTKLNNRAYFEEMLEKVRNLDRWAVFICDLDGMKQINDNFGHEAGDEALRLAAESLQHSFRESDVIARIGGDEFAVIVMNCDEKLAQKLLGRFLHNIETHNHDDRPWKLQISCGYAVSLTGSDNPEELVREADRNMYKVKKIQREMRLWHFKTKDMSAH
jgi:diguanylate cyclase (GGDEF)-like protein